MTSLDLSPDERRELGQRALEWVLNYLADPAAAPLYPTIDADQLQALVAEPLPRAPQDPAQVMADFAAIASLARHNGHPRMFGYVQSSGNFAGAVGDFLASALNQNVTSWRSAPSATAVELQVLDWIKALVGLDAASAALLVGGGSAANTAALNVAVRASTEADLNARGMSALPAPPRVYAADRVHMSIPKAAALIGLGHDAVRLVPTTTDGAMDVAALERAIDEDRAAGLHQICVVASAGEVNTGAIDPLAAIADLCAARRLWLHVDAAYGGFAARVPRVAGAFEGLDRADSVALDPHKWLFAPVDAGCLVVRDERHLRRAFAHGASYIDVVADRGMSELAFWEVGPELSRRFRALKIWFALKCHGADAFAAAIDRNIVLARELAAAIDASDAFERLAPVPLSIVCFRYAPRALRGDDEALNAINRELMPRLHRGGRSYVSSTTLAGRFALRACIVNHRTTSQDAATLLDDVRRAAERR